MAKKKAARSKKGAKAKADLLLTAIRREAGRAANLLERDVEELHAILGAQLASIQNAAKLARAKISARVDKRAFFIQSIPLLTTPPKDEGKSFIDNYWNKIVDRACRWWADNRERFSGKDEKTIIRNLAPAIAPAIPTKFRAGSVVALAAALLVKEGLDKICEEKSEETGESTEISE